MSQQPRSRSARYHIFVLSLWETAGSVPDGPAGWRISLEDPQTGQRVGFTTLAQLDAHLAAWMASDAPPERRAKREPPSQPGEGGDHH